MISLASVIPAQYKWLMFAVAAAAIWGHGWLKGAEYGEDKLDEYRVSVEKATIIQSQRSASVTSKLLSDATTREKVKNDEFKAINRKLSSAIAVGVRLRAERRAANPSSPTACNGATGAELSRPDAEFSIREAARADRIRSALSTCYEQYNQARNALEALNKSH